MSLELAPYLYQTALVYVQRPQNLSHWTKWIGRVNSSCVRRLVLEYSTLDAMDTAGSLDMWSSALTSLPNLQYIMFYYEPDERYGRKWPFRLTELDIETEANLWVERSPRVFEILKGAHQGWRSFSQALLAINEPMPQINALSVIKLLDLNPVLTLEENVTRVPEGVLADRGLHLTSTYAMTGEPSTQSVALTSTQSVALTYRKRNYCAHKPDLHLEIKSQKYERLKYLRLGCPDLDSSILACLPEYIRTLDIALKDSKPEKVASNVRKMRQRCKLLFTLAISVSPLHDVYSLPDGGRAIDQQSVGEADMSHWEPFWEALRYVQSTGVKVWEGDGPGSRK